MNRQLDFMCVQTALEPQSEVQNLVGNHPSIRSYYVLSDGNLYQDRVPYLVTTFQTSESTSDLEGRARQAQKIDAKNPSAVLESRSEYGVPGTVTTPGG